jgi:uncharacterized RDD family membrane protein YckC
MRKVFIIGREPASQYLTNGEIPIIIGDTPETQHVSRTHCKLTIEADGRILVDDLAPNGNGVFVNNQKITQTTEINEHTILSLGKTYRFSLMHPTIQNHIRAIKSVIAPPKPSIEYAGWWQRVGGALLDSLLVGLLLLPFSIVYNLLVVSSDDPLVILIALFANIISGILVTHFYIVVPTHKTGTTYGRRIAGVRYLDAESMKNLSIGQVWGRELSRILSYLILGIGYLMPLWTSKKQALHDMIAGTIVVKNN